MLFRFFAPKNAPSPITPTVEGISICVAEFVAGKR